MQRNASHLTASNEPELNEILVIDYLSLSLYLSGGVGG